MIFNCLHLCLSTYREGLLFQFGCGCGGSVAGYDGVALPTYHAWSGEDGATAAHTAGSTAGPTTGATKHGCSCGNIERGRGGGVIRRHFKGGQYCVAAFDCHLCAGREGHTAHRHKSLGSGCGGRG